MGKAEEELRGMGEADGRTPRLWAVGLAGRGT